MPPRRAVAPSSRTAVHFKPFFDAVSRESVWLLLHEPLSVKDRKTLMRGVDEYARRQHDTLPVWIVLDSHRVEFMRLAREACGRELCAACLAGKACQAWQRVDTFHADYMPRQPAQTRYYDARGTRGPRETREQLPTDDDFEAFFRDGRWRDRARKIFEGVTNFGAAGNPRVDKAAKLLGVSRPFTREGVVAAFRKRAVAVHPDHGGTNAQMREAIEARDTLLGEVR